MWTPDGALVLLLACCLWSAEAQSERGPNIWDDPVTFKTQAKDSCTMSVTGQGELTRLRLTCRSSMRSYWCEYVGRPYTCSPYNKNPRHYFVQMMWGLRKLHNACLAPTQIKPHMCRKAGEESQMVFSSASFSRSRAEASVRTRAAAQPSRPQPDRPQPDRPQPDRPQPDQHQPDQHQPDRPQPDRPQPDRPQPDRPQPDRPQPPRPAPTRPGSARQRVRVPPRATPTPSASLPPATSPVESDAKRMARRFCWRSLQGVCSYVIGLVRQ